MTEQVYTAKEPASTPSSNPPGWPESWTYPGPPWPPGWGAQAFFTLAFSAASAETDELLTLTLTAYTAAGAVDTAYAEDVDVTDNNATLSIKTAAGAAFTGFAAGDFAAGVASASVKFSGAITENQNVTVRAVENGDTSPAGLTSIVITPANLWSMVLADNHSMVRDDQPTTATNPYYYAVQNWVDAVSTNFELLVHLASPIPSGKEVQLVLNVVQANSEETPSSYPWTIWTDALNVLIYPVQNDWTPATVTWNTKPTLDMANYKTLSLPNPTVGASGVLASGTLRTRAGSADVLMSLSAYFPSLPATIYGFLIKVYTGSGAYTSYHYVKLKSPSVDADKSRAFYR